MLAIAGPAGAAQTYTVTQLTDNGDGVCDDTCSLRDAVDAANNVSPGPDTIVLPAGTLELTDAVGSPEDNDVSGDLDIKDNVTIRGQGATATTITSSVGGGGASVRRAGRQRSHA